MWEFVANFMGPAGPVGDWSGPPLTSSDHLDNQFTPGKRAILSTSTAEAIGSPILGPADVEISGVGASAIQEVAGTDSDPRVFRRGTTTGGASWGDWRRTDKDTKTVLHALSLAGSGALSEVAASRHVRVPLKLAAPVDGFRLYFRNYNDRESKNYVGDITFTGVFFGKRAKDTNGVYTEDFAETPTALGIPTRTTLTDGSYRWSVGTKYINLEPHTEYLVSYGYTTTAGQENHVGNGGAYLGTVPGAADYVDASGMTWSQTMPLDVYMTLLAPEDTPVYGYLGSSTAAGVNTDYPVRDSFGWRHAYASGALPVLLAHSGSDMTSWMSTSDWKWQKARAYARLDRLYFNIHSNDVYGAATLADLQTRNTAVAKVVRSQVADQLFYVNVAPRAAESAGDRSKREAYNLWLDGLPNGALATYDVASVVTGPDGSLSPTYNSGDNTHLNTLGQAKTAEVLIRGGDYTGIPTVTAIANLPVASVSNRGKQYYVVAENKPYFSNGTIWAPVSSGAQGDPGAPGAGVPAGGLALQMLRKNSANTTTEWATVDKALVGLGSVDNTADSAKPVSTATQAALDAKASSTHVHDAAGVTTGNFADARMPLRLGAAAASVTDWNLATTNGYYFSLSSALNVPPGGGNILGYTVATATAVTQWAWSYQSDVSTDTKTYRRDLNGSTWSAWARVRQTEAELDLRYARASYVTPKDFGAVGNGTTDDFTAVQAWLDSPIKDKLLSDGIYRVTTGLTCNVAGASIVGRGGTIKADTAEMDMLTTTGVNTVISGLVIDGNTKARYGIYSTGAGTVIERNRVFGMYSATNSPRGIYTSTPGGVTIRNNHISNINGPGNSTQGDSNGLTRGIVMHALTTCTAPSICSGNIITDITGEEADAIAVLYSDTVVTTYLPGHTLIQGNHIRNSSRRYIKVQGSNVTVDSNWCSSAPGFVAVNPSAVIDVIQGKNIVISNNRVEEIGLSSPVSIAGASNERITDITIKGNYLSEGDNASPVVYISYADNVVITDNVLVGGTYYANGGTCDGLVVAGNVCRGGVTANVAFSFTSSAVGKIRLNTIPTGRAEGTSTGVVFTYNG